jgi:hypothetical protein
LDQIGDKHAERRALVADSCGQLASYVPPEQKLSLILSILQQVYINLINMVRDVVVTTLTAGRRQEFFGAGGCSTEYCIACIKL